MALPLLQVEEDEDFWVISETEGLESAMPYSVGKRCIDALYEEGQLDWINELLDYGQELLDLDEAQVGTVTENQ